MAVNFARKTKKSISSSSTKFFHHSSSSNKRRRKRNKILKKPTSRELEEERTKLNPKDLDPHRPHHHHYSHLHHHPSGESRNQGHEEEEEEEDQQARQLVLQGLQLSSAAAAASSSEYARNLSDRMAEGPSHQQQHQQPPPQRSRFGGGGLRSTPGVIVEVQGGHIVRSTGRKDRHSKVCTAKGTRDRRVRLSAHTAIQFYDVQDRLGYDRPSKAVDWLINNAKAAIDGLAELPAWHPTAAATHLDSQDASHCGEATHRQMHVAEQGSSSHYEFGSSFLPPSFDSDAIADTIKSFFPMAAAAAGSNSSVSASAPSSTSPIGFQNYPPDLMSRTSSQNQDLLRLSLQSFQDPIFHHPNAAAAAQHQHQAANAAGHHGLFSGFDASANMVPWNVQESSGGSGNGIGGNVGGGYGFNVPMAMHPGLGHGQSQFFTQRGPLQSSNPPFVRAWADPVAAAADNHSMHWVASGSGFSGFRIPARIQGEEEQHDGISDKP